MIGLWWHAVRWHTHVCALIFVFEHRVLYIVTGLILFLAGAPKRTASMEDAFTVSVSEWYALPKSVLMHAWIATGYCTAEQMAQLTGLSAEQLREARAFRAS